MRRATSKRRPGHFISGLDDLEPWRALHTLDLVPGVEAASLPVADRVLGIRGLCVCCGVGREERGYPSTLRSDQCANAPTTVHGEYSLRHCSHAHGLGVGSVTSL